MSYEKRDGYIKLEQSFPQCSHGVVVPAASKSRRTDIVTQYLQYYIIWQVRPEQAPIEEAAGS